MHLQYTVMRSLEVVLKALRSTACNGVGDEVILQQNTCVNEISVFRH